MPEILPDLINFKNIYLEKVVNLLNLFFIHTIYLFVIEILEFLKLLSLKKGIPAN
jgi:hypothetical protein